MISSRQNHESKLHTFSASIELKIDISPYKLLHVVHRMLQEYPPQFIMKEHVGVGPIKLGMTKDEVYNALDYYTENGLNQSPTSTTDYAFGNSLEMEYDNIGNVQFIGVSFYESCGCDYIFRDKHIGKYSAQELFPLLADLDGNDQHEFNSCEYYFSKIKMTVWDADAQYSCLGVMDHVYCQVGIANQAYHDAIKKYV